MLNDGEKSKLYITLLRGLANDIRNAPGSCDRIGHEWSPWVQSKVRHDDDDMPLRFNPGNVACNAVFRTKAERHCYQCGKEQVDL